MYPHDVHVAGAAVSIWNAALLVAVASGYPMLLVSLRQRASRRLPYLPLRWLLTAYVSTVGAQLFAYLLDQNTTVLPPASINWVRYYFDPLGGPKTLYGAVLALPLATAAVSVPWRDLSFAEALDGWTPPLFVVLGVARVGCFLQGCCYGRPSSILGLSFPPGGPVYFAQVGRHAIVPGTWTEPVIPTQLIEAVAAFAIAASSFQALRGRRTSVFLPAVAAYSACRFGLEFLRDDSERNAFGPFSASQWVALVVLAGYAVWSRRASAR
jgi:phosphatidylglycerol---prolipoprotein diacylglyceryl transferase